MKLNDEDGNLETFPKEFLEWRRLDEAEKKEWEKGLKEAGYPAKL